MSPADGAALPEGATLMPDGRVRYTLRWPVRYSLGNSEQELKEIVVRRKNFADNKAIAPLSNDIEIGFMLFTRLTGIEEALADKIDDVDQMAFGKIVESFTTPGPKTPTSAPAS